MELINLKEDQKLIAVSSAEIEDLVNSVYSSMQKIDEVLKTMDLSDTSKGHRLASNADRLERLHNDLIKLKN